MSFTPLYRSQAPANRQTVLRDSRRSRLAPRPSLVLANGSHDLAAIMREAVRHARRYRTLPTWQRQMAVALRHVWKLAKAERLAGGALTMARAFSAAAELLAAASIVGGGFVLTSLATLEPHHACPETFSVPPDLRTTGQVARQHHGENPSLSRPSGGP